MAIGQNVHQAKHDPDNSRFHASWHFPLKLPQTELIMAHKKTAEFSSFDGVMVVESSTNTALLSDHVAFMQTSTVTSKVTQHEGILANTSPDSSNQTVWHFPLKTPLSKPLKENMHTAVTTLDDITMVGNLRKMTAVADHKVHASKVTSKVAQQKQILANNAPDTSSYHTVWHIPLNSPLSKRLKASMKTAVTTLEDITMMRNLTDMKVVDPMVHASKVSGHNQTLAKSGFANLTYKAMEHVPLKSPESKLVKANMHTANTNVDGATITGKLKTKTGKVTGEGNRLASAAIDTADSQFTGDLGARVAPSPAYGYVSMNKRQTARGTHMGLTIGVVYVTIAAFVILVYLLISSSSRKPSKSDEAIHTGGPMGYVL